jgi:hypothetical protein
LEPKIIITKIIIIHPMLHFKITTIIKWEILHSYSEIALIKIMKLIPIIKKLALWLSLITETETKVFIVLEKEKLNKIIIIPIIITTIIIKYLLFNIPKALLLKKKMNKINN